MVKIVARLLFASRWLLVPFYVALIGALLALLGKDALYGYDMMARFTTLAADDAILAALGLVDLTLTASLLVMVIFSGFANFISPVVFESREGLPTWMVGIDFSELELKLLSSIVTIAGIKLLESYMDIAHETDRGLYWQVALFGAFVLAFLLVAIADGLNRHFNDAPHR